MNAFPGGQSQGGQPAVQGYAPVPQGVPQAGVPAQPIYQGLSLFPATTGTAEMDLPGSVSWSSSMWCLLG